MNALRKTNNPCKPLFFAMIFSASICSINCKRAASDLPLEQAANEASFTLYTNVSDPRLVSLEDDNDLLTYNGIKDSDGNLVQLTQLIIQNIQQKSIADTITFDSKGRYSSMFFSSGEKAKFIYHAKDSVSLIYVPKPDSILTFSLKAGIDLASSPIKKEFNYVYAQSSTYYNTTSRIKVLRKFEDGSEENVNDAEVSGVFYGPNNDAIRVMAGKKGDGTYILPIPIDFNISDPAKTKKLIKQIADGIEVFCAKAENGNSFPIEIERTCSSINKRLGGSISSFCKIAKYLKKGCNVYYKLNGGQDLVYKTVDAYYRSQDGNIFITSVHAVESNPIATTIKINDARNRLDQLGFDAKLIYPYTMIGRWQYSIITPLGITYSYYYLTADHRILENDKNGVQTGYWGRETEGVVLDFTITLKNGVVIKTGSLALVDMQSAVTAYGIDRNTKSQRFPLEMKKVGQ